MEAAVERPAKRPKRAHLAPYESHADVFGGGCNVCLKCGNAWGASRPAGVVCGGLVPELPAMVQMLLDAGALNEGLAAGAAGLRALAGRRGWGAGAAYEPALPPD